MDRNKAGRKPSSCPACKKAKKRCQHQIRSVEDQEMPLVTAPMPDEAGQHLRSAPAALANPGQQLDDEYLSSSFRSARSAQMYLAPPAAPNVQHLVQPVLQARPPVVQYDVIAAESTLLTRAPPVMHRVSHTDAHVQSHPAQPAQFQTPVRSLCGL